MVEPRLLMVRNAVKGWIETGRNAVGDSAQHLLWHEAYHVGQMKLALKIAGRLRSDQETSPATWDVWRR
ncbi:hypothetical protein ACFFLM_02845 [Deinococcus oregonensis]|uniref:DUF4157 domain-containing protein n=1 Tax=Deinococcus oregonensis TaxID=1805970 RepID=A0ABV6AW21_9DEIO